MKLDHQNVAMFIVLVVPKECHQTEKNPMINRVKSHSSHKRKHTKKRNLSIACENFVVHVSPASHSNLLSPSGEKMQSCKEKQDKSCQMSRISKNDLQCFKSLILTVKKSGCEEFQFFLISLYLPLTAARYKANVHTPVPTVP
jgi:hypothetical protein